MTSKSKHTDFLVLGSGMAGLCFALEASKHGDVLVVTKKQAMESNTYYAQGGIATVFSNKDSFDLHIQDTINAGDGLCKEDVVEMVVKSGPERIKYLVSTGVSFTKLNRHTKWDFDLGMEGGHSRRRILHVQDLTGREVEKVLVAEAKRNPRIRFLENHIAIDLVVEKKLQKSDTDNYCIGCYVMDESTGEIKAINAKITLLATGGAGKVYLYTSNPDIATGDGMAMAKRAGAKIANMEFFQFHPTCLYHSKAKSFLISEALRGEGAILRDLNGTPFMQKYHPLKELAPRDIVARAIDSEMKATGHDHVFLDISHKSRDFIENRFPNLYGKCLEFGYDLCNEPIPIVPAAHYSCGGVLVDINGRTTINGLYAAGEVACSGLHGANRLASNSLLEALVFAHRAAIDSSEFLKEKANLLKKHPKIEAWSFGNAREPQEAVIVSQNWDELRGFMWNYVGIVRSNMRLEGARKRLEIQKQEIQEFYWNSFLTRDLIELRNIATVANLIIESAISRKESRGLHYNIDYPYKDDLNFSRDTIL